MFIDVLYTHIYMHTFAAPWQVFASLDGPRELCAWLAVVDADEYLYSREPGKSLRDYVESIDRLTAASAAPPIAWVHVSVSCSAHGGI